ncbi:uncharacterized protein ARMOST_03271 [Armillaria ostoyae]|uniref:Zinc finger PHD-type domain-containing protein n=1 Tax=Armillaria ostoyae TaxID=47428 RepID=A0A284QU09_ARMOS|nr:uncharacterized protein ARMOST_03271 [Armillaria ostoyae]
MPRRASTRTTTNRVEQPTHQPSAAPSTAPALPSELTVLRTNWKWAALSQFFFTFSQLMAMDDLSLNDIEEDLVQGNNIYLPRVMQRLLYTLSYDRKVTSNNWQTALRKQYYKRDLAANPIGPEPFPSASKLHTRTTSLVTPDPQSRAKTEDSEVVDKVKNETPATSVPPEEIISDAGQNEETFKSETPAVEEFAQEEEQEEEESRDWLELSMLEKLDSMHLLMEWQFQNSTRLRTLMKSDDDLATWRIEPIGYDSKRNAYWLVGADRLWIQREPPRPPRSSKSLKRKRPEPKAKNKRGKAATTKRARIEPPPKRGKGKGKAKELSPPVGRRGRAAKAQANIKLDAQAKELAELNRQAAARDRGDSGLRTSSRRQPVPPPKSTPRGTRNSARLRGAQNDDEWQAVPEEWLNESVNGSRNTRSKNSKKTGLESEGSSISDLTDLSEEESEGKPEDEEEEEEEEEADQEEDGEDEEDEPPEPVVEQPEEQYQVPADFIEWETICVTLNEWEHIAERWQNATHYAEKALYKVLTTSIIPVITEELREIVRKKKVEEAVVHRKRSSRIAIKESVREEARQAIAKKAEEEEKMSRARRAEVRQQKEEEARQKRENAREQRRKEREAREAQEAKEEGESAGMPVDVIGNGTAVERQANGRLTSNGIASGSRTPAGEDWELDCEICLRRGINLDDGVPMMCCGSCSKWQHISCHDQADLRSGRPRRNWEQVEFICRNCSQTKRQPHYSSAHPPPAAGHDQYLALRAPASTSNSYGNYNAPAYPAYNPYSQPTKSHNHPQMSDVRSNAAPAYAPQTKAISFTHYQPQQRGFSQTHSSYNAAPYVQPYGQVAPTTQYGQYTESATNGSNGYAYPRSAPSTRWNVTTPVQQPPGYSAAPYPTTERSSAGGRQYPDTQQWQHQPTQKMTDAYSTGYHPNS